MVLTSHDKLGDTGKKTGFWLEEFAAPYYAFKDAGAEIQLAFDAVFYPGGHGPLWDLAENTDSIALIEALFASGKPIAAVCHAPGVLRHVKTSAGISVLKDRNVTGFSNGEEKAAELTDVVPFLVEDMLKAHGAHYTQMPDWKPYIVEDGLLITGQNPASSEPAAKALLLMLHNRVAVD